MNYVTLVAFSINSSQTNLSKTTENTLLTVNQKKGTKGNSFWNLTRNPFNVFAVSFGRRSFTGTSCSLLLVTEVPQLLFSPLLFPGCFDSLVATRSMLAQQLFHSQTIDKNKNLTGKLSLNWIFS